MKYLVTSALPYANGPLHFGHIAGVYLPADIYCRHRRLQGKRVVHVSGSDEHGVAIMLNAQKAKKPYQEYVNSWHKTHKELFDRYQIQFDVFGQTSAPYHKEETLKWFHKLNEKGLIEKKQEDQLQCQDCHNYLPDRFVEGTCYVCGYEKARGDECPNCGTWIEPLKLLNPVCKFCDSKNIKATQVYQWYLMLSKFHKEFKEWYSGRKVLWRKTVANYIDSLSQDSLHDRAITRDLDWGIDVPLEDAKGKKLYVWFDAPIGYVSNLKKHLEDTGSKEDYIKDWWKNDDTEIINFIGKDNIIFHSIIFPVMSMASGFVNPVTQLPANQYVNLMGKQFSKSQGWYVDAEEAMNQFGPDLLRYYLTTLIPETTDSSFTWGGFEAKVNGELANNIGNFVNRSMKFLTKNWPEGLPKEAIGDFFTTERCKGISTQIKDITTGIDQFEIRRSMEKVMALGQEANLYFTERAPWAQMKTDQKLAAETIAVAAVYTYTLGVLFLPYLPTLAEKMLSYFAPIDSPMLRQKVYEGDVQAIQSLFASNLKLACEPEGLVPKVDPLVIKKLDEQFQTT